MAKTSDLADAQDVTAGTTSTTTEAGAAADPESCGDAGLDRPELPGTAEAIGHGRVRRLLDHAPAACFQIDNSGSCVYVNERWVELTDFDEQAALGSGWSEAIHFEDCDRVTKAWAES